MILKSVFNVLNFYYLNINNIKNIFKHILRQYCRMVSLTFNLYFIIIIYNIK